MHVLACRASSTIGNNSAVEERTSKSKTQVPPRFELRLEESESSVITNYTMGPIRLKSGPLRELNPGPLPP